MKCGYPGCDKQNHGLYGNVPKCLEHSHSDFPWPRRPSWDLWFMRQAYVTAERGSCKRKQVGALVVRDRDHRVISGGYNGAPRGMPDCLEVGCDVRVIDGRESCVRTLHAESNALDLCGPLAEPHTLYTTVIPCRLCALRILQHGIARVIYHEYYESQGTKEVRQLFMADGSLNVAASRSRGTLVYECRVDLVHLDVPFDQVRPVWGSQ